jgi:hypothetical protein
MEEDLYLSSLRQLDKNLTITAGLKPSSTVNSTMRSSFNPNNRLSFVNRPIATSASFNQNLNSYSGGAGDNYLIETQAFPYDHLSQQQLQQKRPQIGGGINYRANSSCKIYQDLDEYKGHLEDLQAGPAPHQTEFKGHLV